MSDEGYHKNLAREEVLDVFTRYFEGETQLSIATDYGISIRLVHNILYNKIYRHYNTSDAFPNYSRDLASRKKRARGTR